VPLLLRLHPLGGKGEAIKTSIGARITSPTPKWARKSSFKAAENILKGAVKYMPGENFNMYGREKEREGEREGRRV
jgi:hypothetical protein